jgi:hypothetical protein
MEIIAFDVEQFHLGAADFDTLFAGPRVERTQSGLCRRGANELDDGETIRQRAATPVLCDVAEHAVLDLIPLGCAGRIVVDMEHKPCLVGKLLQLNLPEPHARTVRAAQSAVIVSSCAFG